MSLISLLSLNQSDVDQSPGSVLEGPNGLMPGLLVIATGNAGMRRSSGV